MIGHNPDTPGGDGLGVGMTVSLEDLGGVEEEVPVVVVVPAGADFDDVAHLLNGAGERGVDVVAAVLHGDVGRANVRWPSDDEALLVDWEDARFGDPAEEILGLVRAHPVDIVCMGARGVGRVSGALLGSVSSAVLHNSPVPVVVLHPPASGQPGDAV